MLQEALNRRAAGRGASTTLVTLVCALCVFVDAGGAEPRIINIPPGELATALETVAQQADVELIFQPDQLKGLQTHGVVGLMSAQRAAEKLLQGTGFQVRADPDNGAMMVGAAAAVGEASPGLNADTLALTPLEEVEISARRAKLSEMREEMVKLENRFYAEYNRLNSNHWWDVLCRGESPRTGGRIKFRVCRPRFVDQMVGPGRAGDGGPEFISYAVAAAPNRSHMLKKWADYERNMLSQINNSADLRRLVREREEMEKQYEAARRQKLKGKIVVLE
jgi:hypothetical protein